MPAYLQRELKAWGGYPLRMSIKKLSFLTAVGGIEKLHGQNFDFFNPPTFSLADHFT